MVERVVVAKVFVYGMEKDVGIDLGENANLVIEIQGEQPATFRVRIEQDGSLIINFHNKALDVLQVIPVVSNQIKIGAASRSILAGV